VIIKKLKKKAHSFLFILILSPACFLYPNENNFLNNFTNLHNTFSIGAYLNITDHLLKRGRLLPSSDFSTFFHLTKSVFFEGSVDYQYFPIKNNITKNEYEKTWILKMNYPGEDPLLNQGAYILDCLKLSFFIEYGILSKETDHYFVPTKLIKAHSHYQHGSIITKETYRGNKIEYTNMSGTMIGIGLLYLKNRFKIKNLNRTYTDEGGNYYDVVYTTDIEDMDEKTLCPSLELKFYNHSVDTKRPIYSDIYIKYFFINKSSGFDIGFAYHGFSHLFDMFWWNGQHFGCMFYKSILGEHNYNYHIYWRLSFSV
jgi:hypothetical protein